MAGTRVLLHRKVCLCSAALPRWRTRLGGPFQVYDPPMVATHSELPPPPKLDRDIQDRQDPAQSAKKAARGDSQKKQATEVDPDKWNFTEKEHMGIALAKGNTIKATQVASVDEAKAMVRNEPDKWFACEWRRGQTNAVLIFSREMKFYGDGVAPRTNYVCFRADFHALDIKVDMSHADEYTDTCLAHFQNYVVSSKCPGRGQGICDHPGLVLLDTTEPQDICQGLVGNCWLLSAISSLGEFDGCVQHCFRKNRDLKKLPKCGVFNKYIVTLWDLAKWKEVDIEVDERVMWVEKSHALLGCKPSSGHEVWPCVLEKAVVAHCGGWNKVCGGHSTHGWMVLTGSRDVYTIMEEPANSGLYRCFSKKNPKTNEFEELGNSPHDGFQSYWHCDWPVEGGGGTNRDKMSQEQLFMKMCAWDDANFVMAAGSRDGEDSNLHNGIVDGHAYSIIRVINDAGGTSYDMIQVRNPWGKQEFDQGEWQDDGKNWILYPEVYEACGRPASADDGLFWIQKEDFFEHFRSIYLLANDMKKYAAKHSA